MLSGERIETGVVPGIWLGQPVRTRQEEAFREAGFRFDGGDQARIVVRDDVVVTRQALELLAREGQRQGRDLAWRAGGKHGELVDRLRLGDHGPWLVYLTPGPLGDRFHRAAPHTFVVEERAFTLPAGNGPVDIALADALVLPTRHWLQGLWANLLGLGPWLWADLVGRTPVTAALGLAFAVVRAASTDPGRVARVLVRRGRDCRVHPSAVLEATSLGAGVQIGAGAIVRGSVLGDGAVVEDQALVEYCVLGRDARIQRKAMAKFSVIGPASAFAGTMQLGVIDAEAVVKFGAVLMDMALDSAVRVRVGDELRDAPFGMAGVHVGAKAIVSMGVHVAPGRVIPPGVTVLPSPGSILRHIEPDVSGVRVVRDGALVER